MEKVADITSKLKPIFEARGVALAYLFGSYARGQSYDESDVDIAVLFNEDVPREEYFNRELKLAGAIDEFVHGETQVVNLATVRSPLLKYNILIEGIVLYEKDQNRRLALEQAIVREYEDTSHLRCLAAGVMREQLKQGTFGIYVATR